MPKAMLSDAAEKQVGQLKERIAELEREKQKEVELKESHRLLEYRYRSRSADLTIAVRKLKTEMAERKLERARVRKTEEMLAQSEKLAALGQMASSLAHELKNPLDIVMQGIDYLRDNVSGESPQLLDVSNRVKAAIVRADGIIHDLLDFAHKTPFNRKPYAANELLKVSLDLVDKQHTLRGVTPTFEYSDDLPPVFVDKTQLELAFINIITNAIRAMPEGGKLALRTRILKVTTIGGRVGRRASDRFHPGDSAVVCEIEDSGTGIPPEIIGKVFDPFFTTAESGKGTGLGLAITRTLVELNGGLLTLSSKAGKGTLVRVMLPIAGEKEYGDG